LSIQQLFFINGFTINSNSIDTYKPLTISSKTDRLQFKGILTTPVKGIYRAGEKRTFKDDSISLRVTLTLFCVDTENEANTTVFIVDQQRAKITSDISSEKPAIFEVSLNPFRNKNVDFSTLKFGTYYFKVDVSTIFEVLPDIDIVETPQIFSILSNNLLIRINTSQDVVSDV